MCDAAVSTAQSNLVVLFNVHMNSLALTVDASWPYNNKSYKTARLLSLYCSCCVGMPHSPHSLSVGECYSLFQLTAGLSPATGEHAGKWVTVDAVCRPRICLGSTPSTPGSA